MNGKVEIHDHSDETDRLDLAIHTPDGLVTVSESHDEENPNEWVLLIQATSSDGSESEYIDVRESDFRQMFKNHPSE